MQVSKPFIFGRVPATNGRLVHLVTHITPEGKLVARYEDAGPVRGEEDPYFYLHIGGASLAMTDGDMKECIEEMQYTRQKKAKERPRDIADARALRNKVGDLIEAVKDAKVGRRRF